MLNDKKCHFERSEKSANIFFLTVSQISLPTYQDRNDTACYFAKKLIGKCFNSWKI